MNVDESARHAATTLHESVARTLDLDAMRADLDRTRAKRRRNRVVASLASLAVVVGALALTRQPDRPASGPASRPPHASTSTSIVPSEEQLLVGRYAFGKELDLTIPESCLLTSSAFSPNGQRVAYACADANGDGGAGAYVTDLAGGPSVRILTGEVGEIAWATDSTVVAARGSHLEVLRAGQPLSAWKLSLPDGWRVYTVDVVDRDRVVGVGMVGGRSAIITVALSGGEAKIVLTDSGSLYSARWSPDGATIGFLRRNAPMMSGEAADVTVETVHPDGSSRRVLVRDGKAAFLGVIPGFDWSPEGRIAYVTVVNGDGFVRIRSVDGTATNGIGSTGPIAWRPSSRPSRG